MQVQIRLQIDVCFHFKMKKLFIYFYTLLVILIFNNYITFQICFLVIRIVTKGGEASTKLSKNNTKNLNKNNKIEYKNKNFLKIYFEIISENVLNRLQKISMASCCSIPIFFLC